MQRRDLILPPKPRIIQFGCRSSCRALKLERERGEGGRGGRRHGGGDGGSSVRKGGWGWGEERVGLVWKQEIKVDCVGFEGVESVSHSQLLVRLRSEVVSELVSGWEDG